MAIENHKKRALDGQRPHWEKTYSENPDNFGADPSDPAIKAARLFKDQGVTNILELGGGQGRDTLFFAQNGFNAHVLDYSDTGVQAINNKAKALGLTQSITATQHDVRERLPFPDQAYDACYSHMLYCMALTTDELEFMSSEILRVLKPGGINIFTARNTNDSHYGQGIHRGEDIYEVNGFAVHFLSKAKIERLAKGFEQISVEEFEEGDLPRKLFYVVTKKPHLSEAHPQSPLG